MVLGLAVLHATFFTIFRSPAARLFFFHLFSMVFCVDIDYLLLFQGKDSATYDPPVQEFIFESFFLFTVPENKRETYSVRT